MVAKGVNQFNMGYLAGFFNFISKAEPDWFIPFSDIVSLDSQKGVEGTTVESRNSKLPNSKKSRSSKKFW